LIPISPNLAQWLGDAPRASQKLWPHSKPFLFEAMRDASAKAKVVWKGNGLRHSFITYRLAQTKDVAEVALEAGNSPSMIFRHYRELATGTEANEWFGIVPTKRVENVIRMTA
jgi:hypothetical protein